jgi:hypothetical protein
LAILKNCHISAISKGFLNLYLFHSGIQNNREGGKTSLGIESGISKTHVYLGDVCHNWFLCLIVVGCCLLIFVVIVALCVLIVVFALSKGLVIAITLGKVALLGILTVVLVVEGLVVVIALSIFVIVVAPGVLVIIFALGVLVVIIALGVLVVDFISKRLVIVLIGNSWLLFVYICHHCFPQCTCRCLCPQQGAHHCHCPRQGPPPWRTHCCCCHQGACCRCPLGVLIIVITLSILVVIIAPGVLVIVVAFGILVIDAVGEGLVVVVVGNGRVAVSASAAHPLHSNFNCCLRLSVDCVCTPNVISTKPRTFRNTLLHMDQFSSFSLCATMPKAE